MTEAPKERRALAFYIDAILCGLITNVLMLTLGNVGYWIGITLLVAYFLLRDAVGGKSIGKRIMKLEVRTIEGENITVTHSLIRNASLMIPICFIEAALVLLGKPRLGENWSKTRTVRTSV